jgi:hypothetical protein
VAIDQLLAPIPSIALAPGMSIRFEALDANTGAAVAGVTVKSISIAGPASAGLVADLASGAFMLVPGPQG